MEHDIIIQKLIDQNVVNTANGHNMEIPPKVFLHMEGELLAYEEGKSLKARFPVMPHYQNPLGFTQGGIITAMIDNTIGPLSYLVAPPSLTSQLNTTYIRPVTTKDAYVYVEGWLVERTRNQVHLSARVTNEKGRLVALAQALCIIIPANGEN